MNYNIQQLSSKLEKYLIKHDLEKKWKKTKYFLEINLAHPSLNFEKIILKRMIFYSFGLDNKYRGICTLEEDEIEVIFFTNHYQ